MTEGQKDGTGAMSELDDEKVRINDILSNRDKSQRPPGQSLDSKGMQVEQYKDMPTNQRPAKADTDAPVPGSSKGEDAGAEDRRETGDAQEQRDAGDEQRDAGGQNDDETDRPGFDLGGASGDTTAGKGLGLDKDAKEGREDWRLPRK